MKALAIGIVRSHFNVPVYRPGEFDNSQVEAMRAARDAAAVADDDMNKLVNALVCVRWSTPWRPLKGTATLARGSWKNSSRTASPRT